MAVAFDQTNRPLRLRIQGVEPTAIMLTEFEGTEQISRLYTFTLKFVANHDAPLKFEDVLGKEAVVTLDQGVGRLRHFHGIISRLGQGGRDDRFQYYEAHLVPRLWLLTQVLRSRIFQDDEQRKATDIVKTVLGELYKPDSPDFKKVTADYPERNFTVQYQESDFNFFSRILEEEGIFYYFSHGESERSIIFGDNVDAHQPLPVSDELLYDAEGASLGGEGRILTWHKMQELRVAAVEVSDHNFELPDDRLAIMNFPLDTAQVGSVPHHLHTALMGNTGPTYIPGGYAWWLDGVDRGGDPKKEILEGLFTQNGRVAMLHSELANTECLRIEGTSTYRWLTPGYKFKLSGHFDADGEYYFVSVAHKARLGPDAVSGDNPFTYSNHFECRPLAIWYRPARLTRKPKIRGTQTAVVVGSDKTEIDPDRYGRVKVHFRWDPLMPRQLNTSCWVRVAQFWAGRHWGAQFLPRIGDEVIVAFIEGDPDRPIIIGSVYNADNMPIFPLPNNKTRSGIRTTSSTNGTTANYNELFFEDKKGAELIGIHAENNMSTHVENCYSLTVGSSSQSSGSDVKRYGKSTTQVYGDTSLSVTDGDYSISVGKGKMSTWVCKTIDIESQTDHIHLKSPTNIQLNVNGTATLNMTPGEIKLSVGDSSFITITNDTIHLQSAHIKVNGTATCKLDTPDLDAHGKVSYLHGTNMKVQGTSDCKVLSPAVTILGDTSVNISGGGSKVDLLAAGATLSGATAKVHGDGITTVEGSMVKVNC